MEEYVQLLAFCLCFVSARRTFEFSTFAEKYGLDGVPVKNWSSEKKVVLGAQHKATHIAERFAERNGIKTLQLKSGIIDIHSGAGFACKCSTK